MPGCPEMDDYIARFPPEVQAILQQLRTLVHDIAPDAQEAIKYGIPTFVLHENLVHFAAYRHHIGFYPSPSAIIRFQEELSGYKRAKGSVRFPLEAPMPWGLIRKIIEFRATEILNRRMP